MHDLVDIHRANIAKAGVTLAEAITEATAAYSASVAASEAALQVAMTRRIEAFHGAEAAGAAEPAVSETPAWIESAIQSRVKQKREDRA